MQPVANAAAARSILVRGPERGIMKHESEGTVGCIPQRRGLASKYYVAVAVRKLDLIPGVARHHNVCSAIDRTVHCATHHPEDP